MARLEVGGLNVLFTSIFLLKLIFRSYGGKGACTRVGRRRERTVGQFVRQRSVGIVDFSRFRRRSSAAGISRGRFILFSRANICVRVIRRKGKGPLDT